MTAHRRHDISDENGKLLNRSFPEGKESGEALPKTTVRLSVSIVAVFRIIRTGSPWRDLPPDYGNRTTTHSRFSRWCKKEVREKVVNLLIKDPAYA